MFHMENKVSHACLKTGSHQTNSPSALVQIPCTCISHRQSFCIVRFLTEGPPKRLFLFHEKNICVQAGNKVSVYMLPKTELYGLQDTTW